MITNYYLNSVLYAIVFAAVVFVIIKALKAAAAIMEKIFPIKHRPERIGYPKNWNLIRGNVLKRDEYQCVVCSNTRIKSTLQIHHIIRLSQGGTNDLSNLETLCRDCHEEIHPHMKIERLENEARRKGIRRWH